MGSMRSMGSMVYIYMDNPTLILRWDHFYRELHGVIRADGLILQSLGTVQVPPGNLWPPPREVPAVQMWPGPRMPMWIDCGSSDSRGWFSAIPHQSDYLVGGDLAIWKNMSSSMGRMTSHILWEIKNVPNHQPMTIFQGMIHSWWQSPRLLK